MSHGIGDVLDGHAAVRGDGDEAMPGLPGLPVAADAGRLSDPLELHVHPLAGHGPPGVVAEHQVTVAVRTSAGPGPGHKRLPPGEAQALVGNRRAVYGDQSPRGYADGGADARGAARMMSR
jgi:hypothetical protein